MPPRPKRTTTKDKTSGGDASGNEDDSPQAVCTSSSIKKRTGQACTRCRQRKIKCDHNPRGCQACKDAGEECQVKDRNTDKITIRGEDEDKDAEIKRLTDENRRFKEQLKLFEPPDPMLRVDTPFRDDGPPPKLPKLDPRYPGEAYLGTTGTAGFSVIQGSKLSIYGNEFDLSQYFESSEESAVFQLSDKEYDDHVASSVKVKCPKRPDIQEATENAHLFFTGISFFVPVIHRPTFHELISHLYRRDAPHRPADVDIVIFEMVMSISQFQLAKRQPPGSRDMDFAREAKQRLLYCLTFVPSLLQSTESQAMQGLVLICMAMRHLQRPGPACRFCGEVLARAIELGYHRSITAFQDDSLDQHNIQMRQRLFWCLMVFHVNISGNLGRPLIRIDDYDIEIPEPTDDQLPAAGPDTSPDHMASRNFCSWSYAPLGFRLTQIELQAYCTFRSIRNRGSAKQMHELKLQLIDIEGELPDGPPDPNNFVAYIAGQYLKLGVCATRLKLLHPANVSEAFNHQRRMDIINASGQILEVAQILATYKSLDTTVYYSMDFIHAIFMDLYVAHRNAEDGVPVDMPQLNHTMNKWYWVLGELGEMLGTGQQLAERVKTINQNVIKSIEHILENGNARDSSEPMLGQYHGSISTSLGAYYDSQVGDHVVQHGLCSNHPSDYSPLVSDATLGGDAVSPASSHTIILQNASGATTMNPAYALTMDAMHGNYYPPAQVPTGMQLIVSFDNDFGWSNSMQMHGESTAMDTDMGEGIYNGPQPYPALNPPDLQTGGNPPFRWRGMYDVHPNDGSGTRG